MNAIDAILQELEEEAITTRRVLERVPTDKLGWRPHARARTLGELALHVATLPGSIAERATLDTYDASQPPPAPATEELLPVFDESLAKARVALSSLGEKRLAGMWQMEVGGQVVMAMTRAALLRSVLLNHSYHHRGQLSVYLRELDVAVPSIYGPSADENPFATVE